jgi:hypothetical protein
MRRLGTTNTDPRPAPRARRLFAGLINVGVVALPTAIHWRRAMRAARNGGRPARAPRWTSVLGPVLAIVAEQVGMPGDWVMGVRTVDQRTGARIALWRTLTVQLARIAARLLIRRQMPPPVMTTDAERRRQFSEIKAIEERHRDDENARNAELMRHYSDNGVNGGSAPWRMLLASIGSALLNQLIRRRLAPPVVIDARARRSHSP